MIIKDLTVKNEYSYSILTCSLSRKTGTEPVFIAVPDKYYLDPHCADPFVLAFLLLACKNDEDIIIEDGFVSEELAFNIESILFPLLVKMGCGTGKTNINAQCIMHNYNAQCTMHNAQYKCTMHNAHQRQKIFATGISLGVDSFYSVLNNIKDHNKIMHNAQCTMHNINAQCTMHNAHQRQENPISATVYIYNTTLDKIKEGVPTGYAKPREEVSEALGLEFIEILTNIDQIMNTEFEFINYHTFHNMACALSLRNLIKGYYLATGYSYKEMNPSLTDTASYENYIEKALNFSDFKMICSGGEVSRIEKTKFIAQNTIVQKYLNVCFLWKINHKYINCSKCEKCIRTLLTLDVIGKLDCFSQVFDTDYYKKHKSYFWGFIFHEGYRSHNLLAQKIIIEAKNIGYKIPFTAYFSLIKIMLYNQTVKIKRFINGRK